MDNVQDLLEVCERVVDGAEWHEDHTITELRERLDVVSEYAQAGLSKAKEADLVGCFAVPTDMAEGWNCPECGSEHTAVVGACSCGFEATRYIVAKHIEDDEVDMGLEEAREQG